MKLIEYGKDAIQYMGYYIYHYDGYMSNKYPFAFVHKDYDGAPDSNDNRRGLGESIEICIEQIQIQLDIL